MATIVKRTTEAGDSRYDVRYRDPAGTQRRQTFRRRKDADRFLATTEADKVRGTWIDPTHGRITFAEWWERWWPTTVDLRPSSRARDESYARNHLKPIFGPIPLAEINHAIVAGWVADLTASGLAPATVHKAQQILSKCLGSAVDSAVIRANPCDRVKLPRIEQREMLFLTPNEVATLADRIDERYRAFVVVGAYCGLRFGEMAGLRPQRIDLTRRRLEIAEIVTEVRGQHHTGPPKTRAGRRSVPVPSFVVGELTAHMDRFPGEYVFAAPGGGPLRSSMFRRRFWHPACVAAHVGRFVDDDDGQRYRRYEGLRIHDLRHTAVALWIATGASPKEVAGRAGHASVVTVLDRYGHLLPGHEDEVNERLDALARGAASHDGATSTNGSPIGIQSD